jgi:L-amino acid N-acyltransferase
LDGGSIPPISTQGGVARRKPTSHPIRESPVNTGLLSFLGHRLVAMFDYQLVSCSLEQHGQHILDIFNDAIVNSTALYEYQPRTIQTMQDWFTAKSAGGFPVLGLVDAEGTLLGFASYGAFRPQPAYKYTVEHSVYVHSAYRGRGLGRVLLEAIIASAKADDRHALIGVIDAENQASISLHQSLGFTQVGTLQQVAFKFGRWLDAVMYQLTLQTPADPSDG